MLELFYEFLQILSFAKCTSQLTIPFIEYMLYYISFSFYQTLHFLFKFYIKELIIKNYFFNFKSFINTRNLLFIFSLFKNFPKDIIIQQFSYNFIYRHSLKYVRTQINIHFALGLNYIFSRIMLKEIVFLKQNITKIQYK